jgi:cbb3-type cytochrome oxidase subunit 3
MKSLTDVVSGAGLSGYAEIALVIFLIAFLGVVISLFLPGRQKTYEHLRHLPIDSDRSADTALSRDDEGSSLRSE